MRYELELIGERHLRVLSRDDDGNVTDESTFDTHTFGTLRVAIGALELLFAARSRKHFEATLERQRLDVLWEREHAAKKGLRESGESIY